MNFLHNSAIVGALRASAWHRRDHHPANLGQPVLRFDPRLFDG